jgi:hypothetical protein
VEADHPDPLLPKGTAEQIFDKPAADDVQLPEGVVPFEIRAQIESPSVGKTFRPRSQLSLAHDWVRSPRKQQPTDRQVFAAGSNLLVSLTALAAPVEEPSDG